MTAYLAKATMNHIVGVEVIIVTAQGAGPRLQPPHLTTGNLIFVVRHKILVGLQEYLNYLFIFACYQFLSTP